MSDKSGCIALAGTLDTKGTEYELLRDNITRKGFDTLVIDCGLRGQPSFTPDISRIEVANAASQDIETILQTSNRAQALQFMAQGLQSVLSELVARERIQGIVVMGGSGGTFLGTQAMEILPIGFPKLLVSTNTYSDVGRYGDWNDFVLMPSVVDIAGSNGVIRQLLAKAASTICALVAASHAAQTGEKLIALTMIGNTSPAAEHAQEKLNCLNYQSLIFHANGGGHLMEKFMLNRQIAGVLDLATTELSNEFCGGVRTAGPDRLETAGAIGLPQVVAPGGLDICNFWTDTPIPDVYEERCFYQWNEKVLLMRTTPHENEKLAAIFAEKLNKARGPVQVLIPTVGFSQLDCPNGPFWWPEADRAFSDTLSGLIDAHKVTEIGCHINDPRFAETAVSMLLQMMSEQT